MAAAAASSAPSEAAPLDLFGIIQQVAAAADKGKTMTIEDVVAEFGDEAAKAALAERQQAAAETAEGARDADASASAAGAAPAEVKGDDIEGGGEADAVAGFSGPLITPSKSPESFVLFCGGRGSGKSSLIQAFLGTGRGERLASSSALEYAFARRAASAGGAAASRGKRKHVAHCWELAGGTRLQTLTQVPITAQRVTTGTVVLVASLEHPATVLPVLLRWLPLLRGRCHEALGKLRKKSAKTAAAVVARALRRLGGESHPDAAALSPLPANLIIALTHLDRFQDHDPARCRSLLDAVRFVAHVNGASLVCTSTAQAVTLNAFRSVLSAAVFGTECRRVAQTDPSKPLLVTAGADRLASIALPASIPEPRTAADAMEACPKLLPAVDSAFPRVGTAAAAALEAADEGLSSEDFSTWVGTAPSPLDEAAGEDATEALMTGFEEPVVDAARARRLEELARYAKDAERRLRIEMSSQRSGGQASGLSRKPSGRRR